MLVFAHVTNFYLAPYTPNRLEANYAAKQEEYTKKLALQEKIVALAMQGPTADSNEFLQGYVREALRALLAFL